MALSLASKTAIVTGAGSGINLSFARLLLSKHCNVVFADLALRPEAQELVANHSSASRAPAQAIFQRTNVREWADLERMFKTADEHFGGADVVCPGAGVYEPLWSNFWHPPGSPLSNDTAQASRYASLDINLAHPIRTTQLAIAHFLNRAATSKRRPVSPANPASLLHVSSIAGQVTPIAAPIYNATKHALNGFVRSLAPLEKELGIRVAAVAPGLIRTPLWTENPEKFRLVGEGDEWVTSEFVAEQMVRLVEGEEIEVEKVAAAEAGVRAGSGKGGTRMVKIEGGFILEVGRRLRKVEQFGDAGPMREGNTVTRMGIEEREIFERLGKGDWGALGED